MLTAAAEAGVVELSRFAVRRTCSSHMSSDQVGGRFSRRGVRAAEKISEVGFLYENPGRHAQLHTNHKPRFHSAHSVALGCWTIIEYFSSPQPRPSHLPAE